MFARVWYPVADKARDMHAHTHTYIHTRQVMGATMRDAFDAWIRMTEMAHGKHEMAFNALYFWMKGRLRGGFNALRCESVWPCLQGRVLIVVVSVQ